MIANFFSKTNPSNIVSILFLLLIFYVTSFFKLRFEQVSVMLIASEILVLVGWLLMLFLVYFIVSKNGMTKSNSYSILLYVLFIGFFSASIHDATELISNLLLLMAIRRIVSLEKKNRIKSKLFDAGLWIGVAFIFNPWMLLFLVLPYLGMFLYKRITVSNLMLPVMGLITPVFLTYTYCLLTSNMSFFKSIFSVQWSFDSTAYQHLELLIPVTLLISFALWSMISCSPKIYSRANSLKQSWILMINQLLLAGVLILFAPNKDGSEFLVAFFPVAVIITNYLETIRDNWYKEGLLWLFISVSILVKFL